MLLTSFLQEEMLLTSFLHLFVLAVPFGSWFPNTLIWNFGLLCWVVLLLDFLSSHVWIRFIVEFFLSPFASKLASSGQEIWVLYACKVWVLLFSPVSQRSCHWSSSMMILLLGWTFFFSTNLQRDNENCMETSYLTCTVLKLSAQIVYH